MNLLWKTMHLRQLEYTCSNTDRKSKGHNSHLNKPRSHFISQIQALTYILKPRLGVLCILLCIALGIAHLIHFSILVLFGAFCL